jgi:hypothetical protein
MNAGDARGPGGRRADGPVAGAIVFLLVGPIIWAGHFLFVYGPQSALCAFGSGGSHERAIIVTALIAVVTIAALLLQVLALLRPQSLAALLRFRSAEQSERDFAVRVSRLLTAMSMLGVAWVGSTAVFIDACGQLR